MDAEGVRFTHHPPVMTKHQIVYVVEVRHMRLGAIDATVSCVTSSIEKAMLHMKEHELSNTQWWAVYPQKVDGKIDNLEIRYFNSKCQAVHQYLMIRES